MWGAEVCDLTFEEFAKRLSKFADEEGGFACPYIISRIVNGHEVDIWYDENFLSYQPVPSGVCLRNPGNELMMGMLFITGGDDETGESVSLTDDVIKDVLAAYKVPSMETIRPWGNYGLMMLGYKLIHYEY